LANRFRQNICTLHEIFEVEKYLFDNRGFSIDLLFG
jgi:hypothetical protein